MIYPATGYSIGCSQDMINLASQTIIDSYEKYTFNENFAIFNACTDIKNNFIKKYGGKWNVVIYDQKYGNSSIDADQYMKFKFNEYEIKIFKTSS